MRFLILGPLEVRDGARSVALGSAQQRAVLAALVLRANELVAADELIEALWGERPPATAGKIVQNHVSGLRRLLSNTRFAGEDVIVTRGGGYELRADPDEIDASVFERLAGDAGEALDAGEIKRAAELAREALALWRGAPLADFRYESFAQAEIARLEEQRLLATEHRIEADLALGKHESLLAELEQLVAEHPLRERLSELDMLALYRAGRQAEALDAYGRVRTKLAGLGLEPGRALQDLQAAILAQDPSLGASLQPRPPPLVRRGWALIAAGGAALLAAGVAAAIAVLSDGDADPATGDLRTVSAKFCSPVRYQAGEQPRLLIVSDQPLSGTAERGLGNQVSAAIEFTLRENSFRAGPHPVAYQACDSGTPRGLEPKRCAANAREYATNSSVIGVVGPLQSGCAAAMIPIANRAPGGPLPIVSPSNTQIGLTRAGIGTAPGEPQVYYPTGVRNYVRLMPADDYEVAANAVLARRLRAQRVFVMWAKRDVFYGPEVATEFEAAADKLGIEAVASAPWPDVSRNDYRGLVERVSRSGADAVFLAGTLFEGGDRLIQQLRAGLGSAFPILAVEGFAFPELVPLVGPASEGMRVSTPGLAPEALTGSARRSVSRLRDALGEEPSQFSVYAAAATELLLDSIAHSDGTRTSVIEELFDGRVRHGLVGDFAVTETGDTTANQVTIYRVEGGRLRVEQVIEPSSNLLVRG